MESVLITNIKWESLHDLFIRETEDFFQYQRTNDHIYRRVMSGWAVTVEYRKRSLVNFGEYMIRTIFCPRPFILDSDREDSFPIRRDTHDQFTACVVPCPLPDKYLLVQAQQLLAGCIAKKAHTFRYAQKKIQKAMLLCRNRDMSPVS